MELKPHQFILIFIIFIGLLGVFGKFFLDIDIEYGNKADDTVSKLYTGGNYSEYETQVKAIDPSADGEGFLAQFKLGKSIFTGIKATFSQSKTFMETIGTTLELDVELTTLLIIVISILAIFGIIYLII